MHNSHLMYGNDSDKTQPKKKTDFNFEWKSNGLIDVAMSWHTKKTHTKLEQPFKIEQFA